MEKKEPLSGKTSEELKSIVQALDLPKFTATQITQWIYQKGATDFESMTNISKKAKALLEEKYCVGIEPAVKVSESIDGTKKYLFKVGDNKYVETAYIPDKERSTLCVSSQSGCKMACKFCMTGMQGFSCNLTAGEILNQIFAVEESQNLTNIVFMGMGEPFDNTDNVMKAIEILTSEYGRAMSPSRITVSTVGMLEGTARYIRESRCHLAVSIHNPFADQRLDYMPVERLNPLSKVLSLVKNRDDFFHQRRFSAEYTMIDGYNDSPAHAKELAHILHGIPARINLIRYHQHPGCDLQSSPEGRILAFQNILREKNYITTIRASRGEDIFAACGLLSTLELHNQKGSE